MTCPLCNDALDAAPVVGTTSRHGYPSRRVACKTCGLVQVHPQPDLSDYYASGQYRKDYGPAALVLTMGDGTQRRINPGHPDYERVKREWASTQVDWIEQHAGELDGKRVLEVGSGPGYVLAELRGRAGDVWAIEPDPDLSAKTGAWCGELSAFDTSEPFDVVCSFHVLEHVTDPIRWLRLCRRLLAPTGTLVVEVPNIISPNLPLDGDHFQHVHLFDFSEHTLRACLWASGFEATAVAKGDERRGGASFVRVAARPCGSQGWTVPYGGEVVAGYLAGVRWAT